MAYTRVDPSIAELGANARCHESNRQQNPWQRQKRIHHISSDRRIDPPAIEASNATSNQPDRQRQPNNTHRNDQRDPCPPTKSATGCPAPTHPSLTNDPHSAPPAAHADRVPPDPPEQATAQTTPPPETQRGARNQSPPAAALSTGPSAPNRSKPDAYSQHEAAAESAQEARSVALHCLKCES
jgi:hypothetical protein